MERLLADAQKITGIKYDINSYADVVAAIHVVQTELGITGTTAAEAASTIQGSLSMMGAAWQNLVVGIADENADLTVLIDNLISSITIASENVLPRIEQTMSGIGRLFEGIAPMLASTIPTMVENVLPGMLAAATTMVTTVFNSLPSLISSMLPVVISAALTVLAAFVDTLTANFGLILQTAGDAIVQLTEGIIAALPSVIQTAFTLMITLVDTMTSPKSLNWILATALTLIETVVMGLLDALPNLIEAGIRLIESFVEFICVPENLEKLITTAVVLITTIMNGLIDAIPQLVNAAFLIVSGFIKFLLTDGNIVKLVGAALTIVLAIAGGLIGSVQELTKSALELIASLADTFTDKDWAKIGTDIINSLWSGLKSAWNSVASWFSGVWDSLFNRSVSVGTDGSGRVWTNSHATGLNYVPYDEYQATLHRGEAVLTAAEARVWRNGGSGIGSEAQNNQIIALLSALLDATENGNSEMVKAVYADKHFSVGGREFGRLVREYA